MASFFSGQKCSDCQGNLEYEKENKRWICPYCGKIYEREYRLNKVQIDGMAGINDIVRTTLLLIAKRDMKNAHTNLLECEKIGSGHIGTVIANISYYLIYSSMMKSRDEVSLYLNKVKYYSKELKNFELMDEPEELLYEFFKSQEIYGTLYCVYDAIKDQERKKIVSDYLVIEDVYNIDINKNLLNIMLKENRLDMVLKIIMDVSTVDKKYSLNEVLKKATDGNEKREIITKLLKNGAFTEADVAYVDNYFSQTDDSFETKTIVFNLAIENKIGFNLKAFLNTALNSNGGIDNSIFDFLKERRLTDEETDIIMNYGVNSDSVEVTKSALACLQESGSVYEFEASDMVSIIKSKKTSSEKKDLISYILELFRFPNKSFDYVVSQVLDANIEGKVLILEAIFPHIKSIPLSVIEKYIYTNTSDKLDKVTIFEMIMGLNMNLAFFNSLLSNYLEKSKDSSEVYNKLIISMINHDLKITNDTLHMLIVAGKFNDTEALISFIKEKGLIWKTDTLDCYLAKNIDQYNQKLVDMLLTKKFVLKNRTFGLMLLNKKNTNAGFIYKLMQNTQLDLDEQFNKNGFIGNLMQIYLLTSDDDISVKKEILDLFEKYKFKLNSSIKYKNEEMKFKKYITSHKDKISKDVDVLCKDFGVYGLFF